VGDFVLRKIQTTKDLHKLSPTWEGPYEVIQMTRPDSYRLQREGGSKVPNSLNDDQLRPTLLSGGLHYVLIYVSYNKIYFLLHLFYFYTNNISASAMKDFAWPG
jgi:hypothetical protein